MAGQRGAEHGVAAARQQKMPVTDASDAASAGVEVATPVVFASKETASAAVVASATVALPADCRMSTQGGLMAELLRALDERVIVLDGQAVERIDTASLQLLALFRREVNTRGGTVSWRGPSVALHEAADLLGLAPLLELPATAPV
jgi:anti-anti-sigma regulatory factor